MVKEIQHKRVGDKEYADGRQVTACGWAIPKERVTRINKDVTCKSCKAATK